MTTDTRGSTSQVSRIDFGIVNANVSESSKHRDQKATREPRSAQWWVWSLLIGLTSAFISLGRLVLAQPQALSEVLWAEDGLFPLCIQKANALTCLIDPFAGYLLFLPRAFAWMVSLLPLESWALATNLIAAAFAGSVSAGVFSILARANVGWFASGAAALLATAAPMVGLEVINSLGSSYKLLLFLLTVAVAFPSDRVRSGEGFGWIMTAVLGLVTALTVPTTVVVAALVFIQALARRISVKVSATWILAMGVGLITQAWVALSAEVRRPISLGWDSLNAWADAIPVSILTYWPGLSIGTYEFFDNFTLTPISWTGWILAGALLVVGLVALVRGSRADIIDDRLFGVGLLILAGLGLGLIPTAIGYANNRYFVVPLLLWGTALLVALDPWFRKTRIWALGLIVFVTLVIWWPAIPASTFRSTPAPPWTEEVARVKAACQLAPDALERPIFSPFWPPNWGDGLTEPTHPNLPCTIVWRWL
jgi:hypothetical protein